ncbi:F-box only protein 4 [Echinops telfairi]|uniref:F-box only protein 4 n=1 Tax=Echinops telfairi TaxID=9371 RepID=A0AC55CR85_ECHTE|nr:F-box only protein 4 [Echinops telfairi]
MARSEPRSGSRSPPTAHGDWSRWEAAILSGWRTFWQAVGKERAAPAASQEEAGDEASTLTRLPQSRSLLPNTPPELWGAYYNGVPRPPPFSSRIGTISVTLLGSDSQQMIQLNYITVPICICGVNSVIVTILHSYKMCCPHTRRSLKSSRPMYGAVTSFLHSLIIHNEPRFAMFGPGLEELNTSLVLNLMSSEELCPTAGLPQRQIDGIGSGVNFQLSNQQKFNILILYSTTRKERDRAREEHTSAVNKMFSLQNEGNDQQGSRYSVIPQIQKVCEVVDGFIYVANAEAHKRHEWHDEFSHIMAMTDPAFGSSGRPMLVLSCISQADVKRMPCFYLAHELRLNLLNHPWMVQDIEAETLHGFLNGIQWILEEVEAKHTK